MSIAICLLKSSNLKYGKVRIYKIENVDLESKKWAADPANRKCDAPGSWFCPGQYPPGLSNILSRKKDFAQLEDFNHNESDEEYQRKYFEALSNPEAAAQRALQNEAYKNSQKQKLMDSSKFKNKEFAVAADGTAERIDKPAISNQIELPLIVYTPTGRIQMLRPQCGR
jgi:hypothetical protein